MMQGPIHWERSHPAPPRSLSEELHQFNVWTRRMNVEKQPEAEWRRWEGACNALYDKIEALPSTPQNARIKAQAIWSIAGGDLEDVNEANSTIDRLVRQIIVGLLGDA